MTEKDQRASDYVLGVQTPAERDATRRAAATDPALAREIETLETQMSALLLDAPEVEPPPHLFERIKAAIVAETGQTGGVPGSVTVRAADGNGSRSAPVSNESCSGMIAPRSARPS